MTKTTPTFKRMIGHVPYTSIISKDEKKGKYIAHTKFNGDQYIGSGDSERQATLNLQHQLDGVAAKNNFKTRG